MTTLRIIGDVHCHTDKNHGRTCDGKCGPMGWNRTYLSLIHGFDSDDQTCKVKQVDYSIQLGDLGWRQHLECMSNVDAEHHKVIYGNHDDYDNILPHSLGDYGTREFGGIKFFFIRGELSVDKKWRLDNGPRKSWWHQEELDWEELGKMVELYEQEKPDIVLSHGCPSVIFDKGVVTNDWKLEPSRTSKGLSAAWNTHKPSRWYFGHHHNQWSATVEGTRFECLQELHYVDVVDGVFGEQQ